MQEVREELWRGVEGEGRGRRKGGGGGAGRGPQSPRPGARPARPEWPAPCPAGRPKAAWPRTGRSRRDHSTGKFTSETKAYVSGRTVQFPHGSALAGGPEAADPLGRQLAARGPYLFPDIKAGLFISELKQHTQGPGTGWAISSGLGG